MDYEIPDKSKILIVDDKPMNLLSMEAVIAHEDRDIFKAQSGNQALGMILEHDFALILLDVQMPDMDGFETAELIRSNPKTSHIPIIFVSAINKEQAHLFRGYDSGAVDYLFKPVDAHILLSKIRVFTELFIQRKQRERMSRTLEVALNKAQQQTEIIESQNRMLQELAVRDGLTGLYNHRHMITVLESEFNRAQRYKSELSCLMIDLDFFKEINDTQGHPFGDCVLKQFSEHLQEHMRESDFLFRYGGEEFLVLLPQTDLDGARFSAEKFRKTVENLEFRDNGHTTELTVSIGVSSLYYNHPSTALELIAFSDKALLRAKHRGRNRVVIFENQGPDLVPKHISEDQKILHVKGNLNTILQKAKKTSMTALELMIRDMGDPFTEKRNRHVREYIALLGHHMDLSPPLVETFKLTALIHDFFQTLLGQDALGRIHCENQSGLSDGDKYHLSVLVNLIDQFDLFANERDVLLTHHEHYDGSGYPEGLKEDGIPIGARIFAIADFFVNMIFNPDHTQTKSYDQALINLVRESGKKFDPGLVTRFVEALKNREPNKISDDVFKTIQKALGLNLHARVQTRP